MVELLNIDCMEYMKGLKDKAFDLAIVDPPYGIGSWTQLTGKISPSRTYVDWNDVEHRPNEEYFKELTVVISASIFKFGNISLIL